MKNSTGQNYSPKQGRLPVFLTESLEICDPVLAFDEIMEEIGIERYLKPEGYKPLGRLGYSRVNMLKTILFGFMDIGYASMRDAGAGRPLQGESAVHVLDGLRETYASTKRFTPSERCDIIGPEIPIQRKGA